LLGAVLPWVTLFGGLQPIPGFRLDGGYLAGIGIAAAGLTLIREAPWRRTTPALVGDPRGLLVMLDAVSVTDRIARLSPIPV